MTDSREPILQFFEFDHLPSSLHDVSRSFARLAARIVDTLPRNPERSTALRKLLEAKDAAVCAADSREPILQFFEFDHLPSLLHDVSRSFARLAARIVDTLPRNPERSTALRKLLEAKDAAVRAAIFQEDN